MSEYFGLDGFSNGHSSMQIGGFLRDMGLGTSTIGFLNFISLDTFHFIVLLPF